METKEIINAIITRENVAAGTFARNIGVHPTQIYDLQRGKVKAISAKLANKVISIYPHYSFQWLTTGEGAMLRPVDQMMEAPEVVKMFMPEEKFEIKAEHKPGENPLHELMQEYRVRLQKLEEREQQLMSQLQQKDDQISRLLDMLSGTKSNIG